MNLETKITIYKFTPQLFTLTREKEIGRKEKNAVSRKYKFPKEIPVFLFRWFSRKNSVVFISFK